MVNVSRRRILGSMAGIAVGAAAASLLPSSLQRAMAAPVPAGGLGAIEHVVLLMQENRSFDHYFGSLAGVRGFGDDSPLRLRNGRTAFQQPRRQGSLDGDVLPFSVRDAATLAGRPDSDIQYLDSLDHEWNGSTQAWSQGWWDRWIEAKSPATMTYYERRDLPLQYELADTFTTCDAYHCSMFGGTNPNRNYFFTGTTGFEPGGKKRAVDNAAYDAKHKGYDWTTYPERLEAAGVSWQIYQEWDNFTDNPVEYFVPFKRIGKKMLAEVSGRYRTTEKFYESLAGRSYGEQQRMVRQLSAARDTLTAAERSLFDRGMYRSEPDTLLQRFADDIAADRLPKVSWLVPPAQYSEHPSESTPVGSATFIHRLLDIIGGDIDTWSKTAIFLTFDENDGYFDHVPPPVPPRPSSGNGDDWYDGKAIGLGVRVPMTIISPWTMGGFVSSEVFDHTSVLRFLETWTGVREPNISTWRRTVCGDMTSAFDFTTAGKRPHVAAPGPIPAPITRWKPDPPGAQSLPVQELEMRPSRPLPYQPSVSSALDGSVLSVTLADSGKSSAHFTIYPFAGLPGDPRHYDVTTKLTEKLTVTGKYDLVIQGPNRFWHELRGSVGGPAAGVRVGTEAVSRSTAVLVLANHGASAVILHITPRRYGGDTQRVELTAGGGQRLEWATYDGWYDLEITADNDPDFFRRVTGRIEDGTPSVNSD
ncbi:phosphocholine-specific phospholipase C [Nocardia sp. NBC_01327]|uniref:phosphocholine-specific phospholipase C n=1 Tax=Nocardia sp. NBC_01327 TaxID=2903593 RepID=UPI002E0F930D|nr:phospholipase C, phosphocholine-specific [Nocardia sp. NBC_01327]